MGVSKEWVRAYWAKYARCGKCGAQEKMCCRKVHELTQHKRAATKACRGRELL